MGSGVQPLFGSNNPVAKFKWVGPRGGMISKWRVTKDIENPDIYNVMITSNSSKVMRALRSNMVVPEARCNFRPCHCAFGTWLAQCSYLVCTKDIS